MEAGSSLYTTAGTSAAAARHSARASLPGGPGARSSCFDPSHTGRKSSKAARGRKRKAKSASRPPAQNIHLLTWNIRGLKGQDNNAHLLHLIHDEWPSVNVILFTETHLKQGDLNTTLAKNHEWDTYRLDQLPIIPSVSPIPLGFVTEGMLRRSVVIPAWWQIATRQSKTRHSQAQTRISAASLASAGIDIPRNWQRDVSHSL
jgi:hypothetical protein